MQALNKHVIIINWCWHWLLLYIFIVIFILYIIILYNYWCECASNPVFFALNKLTCHLIFPFSALGTRLSGGHSLHETSSVIVETVTKTSKMAGAYSSLDSSMSTSDASKVVCHGPGLSKASLGQKNNFSVDCSKAGTIKHH